MEMEMDVGRWTLALNVYWRRRGKSGAAAGLGWGRCDKKVRGHLAHICVTPPAGRRQMTSPSSEHLMSRAYYLDRVLLSFSLVCSTGSLA